MLPFSPGVIASARRFADITSLGSSIFGDIQSGLDLMLVLDSSGSMGNWRDTVGIRCYDGPTPTCKKLQTWQQETARALVDGLPANTNVGVVEFDLDANLVLGLTSVTSGIAAIYSAIDATDFDGPTSIGAGIVAATTEISNSGTPAHSKQIVVFSDGAPTDVDYNPITGTWEADTQAAIASGVDAVHSIALPGSSPLVMQGIALNGNGNFIDATTNLLILESLFGS